jgi:hypothetical protein
MKSWKQKAIVWAAQAAIFSGLGGMSSAAWADAGCGKQGAVPIPASELEFKKRLQRALQAQLIVPEQGWVVASRSAGYLQSGTVCRADIGTLRGAGVEFVMRPSFAAADLRAKGAMEEECRRKSTEIAELTPEQKADIKQIEDESAPARRELRALTYRRDDMTREQQDAARVQKQNEVSAYQVRINKIKQDRVEATSAERRNLDQECNIKLQPYRESFTIVLSANQPLRANEAGNEQIVWGDRGRTGSSEQVKRVTMNLSASSKVLTGANSQALKALVNTAGLQAMVNAPLPPDEQLQAMLDKQTASTKQAEEWDRSQNREGSRLASEDRQRNNAANRPSNTPAANNNTVSAPAPAPAPNQAASPAPSAPAPAGLPNVPNIPGNVGNVLRGVFGR